METQELPSIVCVICQGQDSNDQRRVTEIMTTIGVSYSLIYVDKSQPLLKRIARVFRQLRSSSGDLVFIEGTGIGGGFPVLIHAFLRPSVRYLVSSGDAVDSFVRNQHGYVLGFIAGLYERVLYTKSYAFVGWSPYLVGRAFRMGARRGFTLEGAVPKSFVPASIEDIARKREELGINSSDLVIGVSGSLAWSERQSYCYGMELANSAHLVTRKDVKFLIVGDGTGADKLKDRIQDDQRFIMTGRVSHDDMPLHLGVMNAAIISQTSDESGALRLTTKLPEYLACGVPVAMPAIPGATDYLQDLGGSAVWLLAPGHPASETYARSVASWIDSLSIDDAQERGETASKIAESRFELSLLSGRLAEFLKATMPETIRE